MANKATGHIAVIGTGIAGMASAIGLAQAGWQVTIFGPHQTPLQGGLQLAPNGLQALSELQLLEACQPSLTSLDAIEIRSVRLQKILATIDHRTPIERDYGSFHRGTLLDILTKRATALPLIQHNTKMVTACEEAGDALTLICDDETSYRFDVVIGADGRDGLCRKIIAGEETSTPSAYVAMRAQVPATALPSLFSVPRTQLWLGDGYHLVHYPLQQGTIINLVLCMARPRQNAAEARFQQLDGHPYQTALTSPDIGWVETPLPMAETLPVWRKGRLALVGDAAHFMPPHLAQGAGQTLEDSVSLSKAMAQVTAQKCDAVTALSEWAIERARTVAPIVKRAEQTGKIMRLSGPLARLRNMAIDIGGQHFIETWLQQVWQPELDK